MINVQDIKKILKQQVFIIMIGTFLSKILGLLRDTILANYYGAGLITDAYIISTTIPSILIGTLASAILTTFIPVLNNEKEKGNEKNFINNVINVCIIIVTLFIGIYLIFNRQIVSLFVIGFEAEELGTIVHMTNITILVSYALVLISVFSGFLQNRNKFFATSFYGIVFNIISIIGIVISYRNSHLVMPIMFVIGYSVSLLILIIDSMRYGYRYSFIFQFNDEALKKMFILTLPVLLNSIVWDINVVIDKSLISTVGTGYVSALNYSYKVISVATGVIAASTATYIFPKLSLFAQDRKKDFNKTTTTSLCLLLVLLVPITTFFIIYAESIIRILFMRGNFDKTALQITTNALKLYSLSIITIGINTIIYKVFNSLQKNKIPAINAIISIVINIILDILLVKIFSYKGIILATAISNFIATILICYRAKKENINIDYKTLIASILKMIIAVIPATLCSILIYNYLHIIELIRVAIVGIIYIGIYFILLLIQKFNFKQLKI